MYWQFCKLLKFTVEAPVKDAQECQSALALIYVPNILFLCIYFAFYETWWIVYGADTVRPSGRTTNAMNVWKSLKIVLMNKPLNNKMLPKFETKS